ncbi:solute carrier family 22 member 7-like [Amblyomma americanum]
MPMPSPREALSRQESLEDSDGHEEDLSAIIGRTGPFHRTMLAYATFSTVVFALHTMLYAVSRPELVDHWCQLPDAPPNTTLDGWKEMNIPKGPDGSFSRCLMYVRPTMAGPQLGGNETSETKPCSRRFFDVPGGTISVVQEWDLVCDREWLYSAINTAFLVGSFFGLTVSGLLADR